MPLAANCEHHSVWIGPIPKKRPGALPTSFSARLPKSAVSWRLRRTHNHENCGHECIVSESNPQHSRIDLAVFVGARRQGANVNYQDRKGGRCFPFDT